MIIEKDFFNKYKWILFIGLYIHLFGLYVMPVAMGPDSNVYLGIAESILDKGSINLLGDNPLQVTTTSHFPITQVIGGTIFVIPSFLLGRCTFSIFNAILPGSPPFDDLNSHYNFWIGFVSFHLALLICIFMFKICRRYFSGKASITSIILCALGGPVLLYSSEFPLSMNLYCAFVSALLLYIFVFSDKTKLLSWILIGLVCGFGYFIRNEFIIWAILPLSYLGRGFIREKNKRVIILPAVCFLSALLIAALPDFMIRFTIFGSIRTPYTTQFDPVLLTEMPAMLFGGRNGLFSFWPILLISLAGYFIFIKKNKSLFHVLLCIMVLEFILISSKPFWSGETGAHIGQRNILLIIPCFILFGARLFDKLPKYYKLFAGIGILAVLWTSIVTAQYAIGWQFAPVDDPAFLMHHHIWDMIVSLITNFTRFMPEAFNYLFYQRFEYSFVIALPFAFILFIYHLIRQRIKISLKPYFTHALIVFFIIINIVSISFLFDAKNRGIAAFENFRKENPDTGIINSQYDVQNEILGHTLDFVSYFLELDKMKTADYFENKFLKFFKNIDEGYASDFKAMCDGVRLRKSMGWKRLVPEQYHWAVLDWYHANKDANPE